MKISIVIAIYNMEYIVERLFKSIVASSYDNYEVIVCDDCSTDNVKQLVEKYGFVYHKLSQKAGAAKARNEGVEIATGEIILFSDADTELLPNTLELIADRFMNKNIHTLEGYEILNPYPDNYIGTFRVLSIQEMFHTQGVGTGVVNFWSTTCGAIRKDAFKQTKGFDERFKGADVEDIEICFRIPKDFVMYHDVDVNFRHHYKSTRAIHWNYLRRAYHIGTLNWDLSEHSFYDTRRTKSLIAIILFTLFLALTFINPLFIYPSLLTLAQMIVYKWYFFKSCYQAKGVLFLPYAFIVTITIAFASGIGFALGKVANFFKVRKAYA
jgi:glycosyltransferase involved in cell wall biosynthesis